MLSSLIQILVNCPECIVSGCVSCLGRKKCFHVFPIVFEMVVCCILVFFFENGVLLLGVV